MIRVNRTYAPKARARFDRLAFAAVEARRQALAIHTAGIAGDVCNDTGIGPVIQGSETLA